MGTRSKKAMPKPAPPAGFGKKGANKEWAKKMRFYAGIAVFAAVCGGIFFYAEYEAAVDRNWADSYERRCEACQTIVTSGVLTRSMIFQQQKKQQQEERQQALEANPDIELPAEEEPQISATTVLRYMCQDQQVEQLLANNRFTFDNGYSTIEDPEFGGSLKKLCWFAMRNSTTTQVLKKMLEVQTKPIEKPTLVSLSKVHFSPVCVNALSMCSGEELEQGSMVDPQAEEPAAAAAGGAATDKPQDAAAATEPAADKEKGYTEL